MFIYPLLMKTHFYWTSVENENNEFVLLPPITILVLPSLSDIGRKLNFYSQNLIQTIQYGCAIYKNKYNLWFGKEKYERYE